MEAPTAGSSSNSSTAHQETPSPLEASSPEFFEVCSEGEESEEVADLSVAGSKRQRRPSTSQYAAKKKSKLSTKNRIAQSTPITLKWLGDNYMEAKDQCLPRSTLYMHYQDFCKKNFIEPVSQASFGKFIRQKFPNLSTRRLGTRGQSKYHYYGIAIKETSPYFHCVYSRNGLTRFATHGALLNPKKDANQFYTPNSKCGTLLPDFPSLATLQLKAPFPIGKMDTFLMMYRTHCQRIVDTVVRTNFDDVQEFLVHFWQGMPNHLLAVLGSQTTVDLITVCDFVTYQTLLEVLVPSSLQPMSDGLMKDILQFSGAMLEWLVLALGSAPSQLALRKYQVAEMFSKQVAKQISLITLAQPARAVLRSSDAITGLLDDWRAIKFAPIISQAHTVLQEGTMVSSVDELVGNFCSEFEKLLLKQPTLDIFFEWLDSIVEQEVAKVGQGSADLLKFSQQFQMLWNHFSSSMERELTLNRAKSYGAFKDLVSVLDEYIVMVTELLLFQNIEKQYRALLTNPISPVKPLPVAMAMQPTPPGMPHPPSTQTHPSVLAQPRPHTLSVISHAMPRHSQHTPTQQSVIYQPSGGSSSFQPGNSCHGYSHPPPGPPPCGPVFPKAEPEYHSPCSSGHGAEQPHPLPYNATSFPMTPSPSHASSSLSASPEPMTFDPLGFPETSFEVCSSSSLLAGTSPHYDYTMSTPRYTRVDSVTSATCSSQCSFYSDAHPLMSPSLATPTTKDFLAMSPLATNDIGCLFDSAPYNAVPIFHSSSDLDWLGTLTPECEEKLFDPCGLFAPSNIPVPLV